MRRPPAHRRRRAPPIEGAGAGPFAICVSTSLQLALEQNLDVQIERINPRLQDLSIEQVAGVWKPNLTGQMTFGSTTTPPDSLFSGAENSLTSKRLFGTAGVDQLLPFGGTSYSVGWDSSRQRRTTSSRASPAPGSGLASPPPLLLGLVSHQPGPTRAEEHPPGVTDLTFAANRADHAAVRATRIGRSSARYNWWSAGVAH